MIDPNDIRWEDFSKADQEDIWKLRDAILEFEKQVRVEEITLFNAIYLRIEYIAHITDFFQFGTFVKVTNFEYDTMGKVLSKKEIKWLDALSVLIKGSNASDLLENKLDTSHLVQLKAQICNSISNRNDIPVDVFCTEFFLDYEIAVL